MIRILGAKTLVVAAFMSGLMAFLTAKTQTWSEVEATGGIRVQQPVERDGRLVLPVEYNVSGLQRITCAPTAMNSGEGVKSVRVAAKGDGLWVSVVICVAGPEQPAGGIHTAELSDVKPGTYAVYYGDPGDMRHKIGTVVIAERKD